MRFILPLLSLLLLACTHTQPSLSKEDKNSHKILDNQREAQKAQKEYKKLKSSHL